jgi:vesicle transport protein SEC22
MSELQTLVARQDDGLILAETWEGSEESRRRLGEAKRVLGGLRRSGVGKFSVDVDESAVFHCMTENGVVFLTVTSRNFNKRVAFTFLEEVSRAFVEELKRVLGTSTSVDYRSFVDTINKPYYFITFDRTIQKKRTEFKEPQKVIAKLQESLTEVNNIVKHSMNDLINRGENLEDIGRRAEDLKEASRRFAKQAQAINLQALLRQYGVIAAIGAFFLLILWFRFF